MGWGGEAAPSIAAAASASCALNCWLLSEVVTADGLSPWPTAWPSPTADIITCAHNGTYAFYENFRLYFRHMP